MGKQIPSVPKSAIGQRRPPGAECRGHGSTATDLHNAGGPCALAVSPPLPDSKSAGFTIRRVRDLAQIRNRMISPVPMPIPPRRWAPAQPEENRKEKGGAAAQESVTVTPESSGRLLIFKFLIDFRRIDYNGKNV